QEVLGAVPERLAQIEAEILDDAANTVQELAGWAGAFAAAQVIVDALDDAEDDIEAGARELMDRARQVPPEYGHAVRTLTNDQRRQIDEAGRQLDPAARREAVRRAAALAPVLGPDTQTNARNAGRTLRAQVTEPGGGHAGNVDAIAELARWQVYHRAYRGIRE